LPTSKGLRHIISGRNQLIGRVINVGIVGLLAKVVLDVGVRTVTANITSDACRDLGLKRGQPAAALIKATGVMIIAAQSLASRTLLIDRARTRAAFPFRPYR
jgi:molybdopterin-binding protein